MAFADDILLVGLNYKTAPVVVRQRFAVSSDAVSDQVRKLTRGDHAEEAWLMSTCNRTEVMCVGGQVSEETLRERLFADAPIEALYVHRGQEAVFHLFRVASGLDSQVLGESQILSQVKVAVEESRNHGTLGQRLGPLMDQALSVGKRVRTETRVGEGTLSVAKAAVELAEKVLGRLKSAQTLIVGAGETGMLVARHLRDVGARHIRFANRTFERAQRAAEEFGGDAVPLDEIGAVLSDVDLSVVSVTAPEPVVRAEHFNVTRLKRHDRPPMLVDLSVPRGAHEDVSRIHELLVHDLVDLDAVVARHHREREAEVAQAEQILVEEVHKYLVLRAYAALKPVMAGMKDRFERACDEVLEEIRAADGGVEDNARKLTRRLLNEALVQIKEGTRQAFSAESVEGNYRRYLERS